MLLDRAEVFFFLNCDLCNVKKQLQKGKVAPFERRDVGLKKVSSCKGDLQ